MTETIEQKASDTPRTDQNIVTSTDLTWPYDFVHANFARELERELAEGRHLTDSEPVAFIDERGSLTYAHGLSEQDKVVCVKHGGWRPLYTSPTSGVVVPKITTICGAPSQGMLCNRPPNHIGPHSWDDVAAESAPGQKDRGQAPPELRDENCADHACSTAPAADLTDAPTPSTLGHPACNYNIDGWCHDTQCMNAGKCKIDGQVDTVVRQCEIAAKGLDRNAADLIPGPDSPAEIERRCAEWAALDSEVNRYSENYEYGDGGYVPNEAEIVMCNDFFQGLLSDGGVLKALARIYPIRARACYEKLQPYESFEDWVKQWEVK